MLHTSWKKSPNCARLQVQEESEARLPPHSTRRLSLLLRLGFVLAPRWHPLVVESALTCEMQHTTSGKCGAGQRPVKQAPGVRHILIYFVDKCHLFLFAIYALRKDLHEIDKIMSGTCKRRSPVRRRGRGYTQVYAQVYAQVYD